MNKYLMSIYPDTTLSPEDTAKNKINKPLLIWSFHSRVRRRLSSFNKEKTVGAECSAENYPNVIM